MHARCVDVQDSPAIEREHEEDVEHAKRRGRHGEEVDSERAPEVIADERPPRLRGRSRPRPASRHVPHDRVLADDVPQLGELARDPSPAPRRVFLGHPLDEVHDYRIERRTARATRPPSPEADEAATVPADDGRGLHAHDRLGPSRQAGRRPSLRWLASVVVGFAAPTRSHSMLLQRRRDGDCPSGRGVPGTQPALRDRG